MLKSWLRLCWNGVNSSKTNELVFLTCFADLTLEFFVMVYILSSRLKAKSLWFGFHWYRAKIDGQAWAGLALH